MDAANCKMWELSVGRNLEVVPRVFPQQMGAWLAVQSHGQVGGGGHGDAVFPHRSAVGGIPSPLTPLPPTPLPPLPLCPPPPYPLAHLQKCH